jgi:hypothetical protein
MEIFSTLSNVRNKAVHVLDSRVDVEEAQLFAELSEELLKYLRSQEYRSAHNE